MYRLLFRKPGADAWDEGMTFSDDQLTPEAIEILVERHAREGLETKLVRLTSPEGEGE